MTRAALVIFALGLALGAASAASPPDWVAWSAIALAFQIGRLSRDAQRFLDSLEDDSRVSEATRQRLDR